VTIKSKRAYEFLKKPEKDAEEAKAEEAKAVTLLRKRRQLQQNIANAKAEFHKIFHHNLSSCSSSPISLPSQALQHAKAQNTKRPVGGKA
jgi:hypothetical protein